MPEHEPPPPTSSSAALTYRAAGVDIEAGNEAVRRIRSLVARTRRPEQVSDIGGFAGLMALPGGVREPLLVSCTDGVGTKLLVAIAMDRHDTVGIDLVAMNVNDLVCTGGQPLFVLDYVACGRLRPEIIEAIVAGVVEGCVRSQCSLLGGETAELPGLYADGHYDLAAFAVGVVERSALWGPARVREDDVVLGLPSTGLHSNGYSLARTALLDPKYAGLALEDPLPGGVGARVGEALLEPTAIYVRPLLALAALPGAVHAAAHITGGGLVENPPRVVPDGLSLELDLRGVPLPPIMAAIAAQGVSPFEMRRTFNLGLGMLLLVDRERVGEVERVLADAGQSSLRVGRVVVRGASGPASVRFVE